MTPQRASSTAQAGPFLKWAGGKGRLLTQYQPYFCALEPGQRYCEPFLGGGAVFFHLRWPESLLSDVNREVVEAYRVVRDRVDELIVALATHRQHHRKEHFYHQRDQIEPAALSPVERVARFIYLNRTCYNGLHRVNRAGRFNVPLGSYRNPTICDAKGLRAASAALQTADLKVADFEAATADLAPGDLVYFDPPYAPASSTANFTSYAQHGFGEAEQERLARVFGELAQRGCRVMLSNSDVPLIRGLYEGHGYRLTEITARRQINSDPNGRGPIGELLITNYAPADG